MRRELGMGAIMSFDKGSVGISVGLEGDLALLASIDVLKMVQVLKSPQLPSDVHLP